MRNSEHVINVRDLRAHLKNREISPEVFAAEVQLSHMTIRRWLKRPDSDEIPDKYYLILRPTLAGLTQLSVSPPASFDVEDLMNEIEKSGTQFKDVKTLDKDVTEKLKSARVDKIFIEYCKTLIKAVKNPKTPIKARAMAVGALIYFVSPIDLIPDNIPVIGYLDDLAVLSLAVNSLAKAEAKNAEKLAKEKLNPGLAT